MRRIALISCLLVFIAWLPLSGQDIHFSQFHHAPMVYNPALTGAFDGDWRFIGNQRTQWRSVTVPYSTLGSSVDWRNTADREGLHTGLSIYQDRAGDSRLNTLSVNLASALQVARSSDSLHTFTIGMQLGVTHRRIDYSELSYDSQWNGFSYSASANSGEQFARDARAHMNLNLGFAWRYYQGRRHELNAGIALHNANGPRQSFFDDPSIRLDLRVSFSGWGHWEVDEEWDAMGGLLVSRQGTYTEVIPSAGARYIINESQGLFRTLFAYLSYRSRDAGFITVGMDYDQWRGAISYDFNTSDLRPASNGRGGLELSLVYIIHKFRPPERGRLLCPEYL